MATMRVTEKPARQLARELMIERGIYGGDCAACKHPVVKGRSLCTHCERYVEAWEWPE